MPRIQASISRDHYLSIPINPHFTRLMKKSGKQLTGIVYNWVSVSFG